MLKTTASFKMKKHLKWVFHNEHDSHRRGELKRQMIQAQLASEIRPKEKKSKHTPDLEV